MTRILERLDRYYDLHNIHPLRFECLQRYSCAAGCLNFTPAKASLVGRTDLSLSEKTVPPIVQIPAESTVELSWKDFSGANQEILEAAIQMRCHLDRIEVDGDSLNQQLRFHVHRGLGYLAGTSNIRSISALFRSIAWGVGNPGLAPHADD